MGYTWVRITGDNVICKGKAFLGSIILTPSAADKATTVTLYDGESALDTPIIHIMSGTGITRTVNFSPPLVCHKGLYADAGGDFGSCLIQYDPGKP